MNDRNVPATLIKHVIGTPNFLDATGIGPRIKVILVRTVTKAD